MGNKRRRWEENAFGAAEDTPAAKQQKPDEELGLEVLDQAIEQHRRMITEEATRLARLRNRLKVLGDLRASRRPNDLEISEISSRVEAPTSLTPGPSGPRPLCTPSAQPESVAALADMIRKITDKMDACERERLAIGKLLEERLPYKEKAH